MRFYLEEVFKNIYIAPWTANSINELIKCIYEKPLMFPDKIKLVSENVKDVIRKCLIINEGI